MLILTRRVGEKVVIGNNIVVTVLKNKGNYISVGIDAPRSIPVSREEVLRARETKTEQPTECIKEG